MECPICVRQVLLANLKLDPRRQEERRILLSLIVTKDGPKIDVGYNHISELRKEAL